MADLTPLDEAHAIMAANEGDEAARMGFFARLVASELFVLLEREAEGDRIEPQLVQHEGMTFALVFDREERLAEFAGEVAPLVALSGRVLTQLFHDQDIGIALNPDVAPSSVLLPADVVDWLAETVAQEAEAGEGRVSRVTPPKDVSDALLLTLDRRVASFVGRAHRAYLVGADYDDGRSGLMLAVVGAVPEAEAALAQAVTEVVAFSPEPVALDVAFFDARDMALGPISDVGLRFDVPVEDPHAVGPSAPGMDPDAPPKLR
ncbi:SseB family protein [Pseudaestuariivita atlantica]|uniref:SseB protein N-terminal domain-containing protein n=1 Tax=Pseudaestuariivita atlantica TaxID=1317121 RepID=A0A0L1JNC4_9RHOB|nr:SseB family protein [Pseudaestuariivita atlantica]KNG93212.1 hypothetical protein ATO11_12185 [Pseudaestuariivita atlantica]